MAAPMNRRPRTLGWVLALFFLAAGCAGAGEFERPLATVRISTDPPGASVAFDGLPRGKAKEGAPIVIKGVPYGWHTLNASFPGRVDRVENLEIRKPEVDIRVPLSPSTYGSLSVYTDPPGAEVFINSNYFGTANPKVVLPRLPFGEHSLWVRLKGYGEERRSITVERQTDRAYRLHLGRGEEELPEEGSVFGSVFGGRKKKKTAATGKSGRGKGRKRAPAPVVRKKPEKEEGFFSNVLSVFQKKKSGAAKKPPKAKKKTPEKEEEFFGNILGVFEKKKAEPTEKPAEKKGFLGRLFGRSQKKEAKKPAKKEAKAPPPKKKIETKKAPQKPAEKKGFLRRLFGRSQKKEAQKPAKKEESVEKKPEKEKGFFGNLLGVFRKKKAEAAKKPPEAKASPAKKEAKAPPAKKEPEKKEGFFGSVLGIFQK